MTIQERTVGDISVLDVEGTISATERRRKLRVAIERLLAEGRKHVVINMQQVPYIDSTGLADLIEVVHAARRHGSSLALTQLTPHVEELLTITMLSKVVPIFACEADALASFMITT